MVSCNCPGGALAAIGVPLIMYGMFNAGIAYEKIQKKLSDTISGNDNNGGNANWGAMENYGPELNPVYMFIGNGMPKTDLSECSNVVDGVTITLADFNDTDGLDVLADFEGINPTTGVVELTKVCKTGQIGSSFASFPVGGTFNYPACKNNCDQYKSGWSQNYPVNYALQITSTYEIDGKAVGVYAIHTGLKKTAEDTWGNLQNTAGSQANTALWSLPLGLLLALVSCFSLGSQATGDEGIQLNQS